MINITNFFALFLILLSINIAQSCLQLWSNHCSSHNDCCGATTWCDTQGGSWAYGVCKPGGKRVVQTNEELRSTNTFPSSSTVPTTKTQKL